MKESQARKGRPFGYAATAGGAGAADGDTLGALRCAWPETSRWRADWRPNRAATGIVGKQGGAAAAVQHPALVNPAEVAAVGGVQKTVV
ncbi:hypothetical protein B0919_17595 [Hymenobacter sp. CRA2]|nr:hypothetical protein B0919_17595 [Hymenobacter sp. CRA2]